MTHDPAEEHHNKSILSKAIELAFEISAAATYAFDTQRKLTQEWAEALNPLSAFLKKDPKTPLVQDESALQIQREFSDKYGLQGIHIVEDFVQCQALNGGKKHKGEPGYYEGNNYSIPAMFYLMDRALSEHNTSNYLKHAYNQFTDDVERMFDNDWTSDTPLPTQQRLQNISRNYLKKIRDLPVLDQKAANESESNKDQQASAEL